MNFRTATLSAALLAAITAMQPSMAQAQPSRSAVAVRGSDEAAAAQRITATATVTAVDAATRLVTLRGEQGNELVVEAGPEVRNFDHIKVGDKLNLTFTEAVTIDLKKKGTGSGLRERRETVAAAPGAAGQPGGSIGRKVTLVADVTAVNLKEGTVTLRGTSQTRTLPVRDAALLRDIKVGDQVEVSYAEALAVDMTHANKP